MKTKQSSSNLTQALCSLLLPQIYTWFQLLWWVVLVKQGKLADGRLLETLIHSQPSWHCLIFFAGLLVEELLIDDISPATLDDISTMLEPWLIQRNVQQRSAAVYILRITLQAYYHHMTFGYEVSYDFYNQQKYIWCYIFHNLMKPVTDPRHSSVRVLWLYQVWLMLCSCNLLLMA